MSATATQTVLEEPGSSYQPEHLSKNSFQVHESINLGKISSHADPDRTDDVRGDLPAPSTAVEVVERWNSPRSNMYALFGTYWSFLVLGANDASPGPLIPYMERYYDLSYTVVSLIFLSPVVGYSAAALLNNSIHRRFGQRGIAFIAGTCHFIAYLTAALHPPWPVIVVFFVFAGFGNGLADAGWCAWTGAMHSPNKVQGILQSFYALGATISPLIGTTMVTKAGLQWYHWYWVMTTAAAIETIVCTFCFRHKDGAKYQAENPIIGDQGGSTTLQAFKNRVTLTCAAFFMVYVGSEVALGGWIVTFMLRVRKGSPYASGVSGTGFWAGMTVGRVVLGFITEKFGERLMVSIYLVIALGLELIFWLVPNFIASAIAVAFLGCFFGPIFPAGVVMCAKLLPKHMHVSSLGAATAIAGVGGAGVPFAVGAIAQARGVWVLQPIVLACLAVVSLLWLSLPRVKKVRSN